MQSSFITKNRTAWFMTIVLAFSCVSFGMVSNDSPSYRAEQPNVESQAADSSKGSGLFVVRQGGTCGYIDNTGKIVIPPQFEFVFDFSEGLAAVVINDKVGYIDMTGKIVIPPQFERVGEEGFKERLARVEIDGKFGFIDKTGKIIIQPKFENVGGFSEGLARVEMGGKWGFIDRTGKTLIPPRFSVAQVFSEGLAKVVVSSGGKHGYIDKSGKIVIEPKFEGVEMGNNFSEGLANIMVDGKAGFIDKVGNIVIPPQFDGVGRFSDGRALVLVGGKMGYIDKTGKTVIPVQFDDALNFSEGLAAVKLSDNNEQNTESAVVQESDAKWGFIDTTGKIVIPPQFLIADLFSDGLAYVSFRDLRTRYLGYIDKTGKFVWRSTELLTKKPFFTKAEKDSLSLIERIRIMVERLEAVEMGKDSPRVPTLMQLEDAVNDLMIYLPNNPFDAQALILFARSGRQILMSRPLSEVRQDSIAAQNEFMTLHSALDEVLAQQPENAEALYWKARLYGTRLRVARSGVTDHAFANLDEAIRFAKRAVELAPENVVYRSIYLLLSDWKALPLPKEAVFFPDINERFVKEKMTYADLRTGAYLLPITAAAFETFYRSHWPGFQLFKLQRFSFV